MTSWPCPPAVYSSVPATAHRSTRSSPAIERAGFRIERVNEWAPYSGWLTPASERAADALSEAATLARLLNVRAEPEMITARRFKPSSRE